MLDDTVTIGGYLPVASFLRSLNARTKILIFCILLYCSFSLNDSSTVLLNFMFTLFVARLSQAPVSLWLRCLWRFFPMLAITFLLNLLFTPPGFYFEFAGVVFPIGRDSLFHSVTFTIQLACVIMLALTLTFSTSPSQFTYAIQWLMYPLSFVKLPVKDFSLVVFMALRFVPLFQQELNKIREAQISRGMNFQSGSALTKGKKLLGLFHPAFTSTIKRSELLAQAMTSRGFVPDAPRTNFGERPFSKLDLISTIFFLFYLSVWYSLS